MRTMTILGTVRAVRGFLSFVQEDIAFYIVGIISLRVELTPFDGSVLVPVVNKHTFLIVIWLVSNDRHGLLSAKCLQLTPQMPQLKQWL